MATDNNKKSQTWLVSPGAEAAKGRQGDDPEAPADDWGVRTVGGVWLLVENPVQEAGGGT